MNWPQSIEDLFNISAGQIVTEPFSETAKLNGYQSNFGGEKRISALSDQFPTCSSFQTKVPGKIEIIDSSRTIVVHFNGGK